MLLSLIVFAFVFSLVILVHEVGHYALARRHDIKVLEFGIGYPPRLRTLAVRNDVEYTLNALPIGGFVRMLGEEDPSDPHSFAAQSAGVRINTLLAGSVMNLILAAALFAGVFMLGEQIVVGKVVVDSVADNSPAERAGLLPGDVVTFVQEQPIQDTMQLVERLRAAVGQDVRLTLLRDGAQVVVYLTPRVRPPPGEGAVGIVISLAEGFEVRTLRHPIWEAIPLGIREVWSVLGDTIAGFLHMFRVGLSASGIVGPVGIVQLGGAVAQTGLVNLMRFAALLSVNLFIVNLLPIPALDGGRIVMILLEKVRGGRRFAPEQEGLVHFIGMLLLLAFTAVVSYYDLVRIFSSGSAAP